jgi:hypothetical protein
MEKNNRVIEPQMGHLHVTAQPEDSERIYFEHLLSVAEELLMLLPDRMKNKYGLIKKELAARLGSPQDIAFGEFQEMSVHACFL